MARLFLKLAVLAGLVLAVDLALARVLELGRPADYAAFMDSKKGYDTLAAVDILFLGDSTTADAFVPSVFGEKLGATAFNYGVYQLSPFEGHYLLRDLVGRRSPPPRLVVLGTDVEMFHYPASGFRYAPAFIESPVNLLPMLLRAQDLGVLSAAGRRKYLLPGLIRKVTGVDGPVDVRRDVRGIDNGYLVNERHFSDPGELDPEKNRDFFAAGVVAQQREFFLRTLAFLRARRIPFVIANIPMHSRFLLKLRKLEVYRDFRGILGEVEAAYGVAVFNRRHDVLLSDLEDEDFLDGDHLCYTGAVKFSSRFAAFLAAEGYRFGTSRAAAGALPGGARAAREGLGLVQ